MRPATSAPSEETSKKASRLPPGQLAFSTVTPAKSAVTEEAQPSPAVTV